MARRDAMRRRQPQAMAASRIGAVQALEGLEQLASIAHVKTATGVPDLHMQPSFARFAHHLL